MSENLELLTSRLRKAGSRLPYLPWALRLVWQASRAWTAAWTALLVLQGLLPVATVYLTRPLVNAVVAAVRSGGAGAELHSALVLALLMTGVLVAGEILRSAAVWVRTAQSELVRDYIAGLVHEKSAAADMAFYDQPDFFDHLYRARAEASDRPLALVESLGGLLQNGITLAAMLAILAPFGPWLPVALLLSTLPACGVVFSHTLRKYHWRLRNTARERRAWYYDWLLTARETASELRLFGLGGHFRSAYQDVRRQLRKENVELARRHSVAEFAAGIAALAMAGGAMGWMLWRTARGSGTLGDLALFYQAFNQGLRLMRSLLEGVGQLYANLLFLGNLFEFLSLETTVTDPAQPSHQPALVRQGILFRGVTFRYPGAAQPALAEFDLAIPAGRIAAIVGPNGAGKSTLIKLLCRFYDPDRGSIEIDGSDLRAVTREDLRQNITVLFQQPVNYNDTAAQNIALGDLASAPGPGRIDAAARSAGADEIIARLPEGYDNLLGKWFSGGAELSVGEWQRIALARAFLRQAPIIVLDEPTSAMDPWAEADWLERFRRLAEGRTAIVVTHRFTTAMHADVIHVLAGGRIVESGSHTELMARGGHYAQGWSSQMKLV